MALHSVERAYIDRRAEAMAYIAQKLGEMDPDLVTKADFGEYVRTMFIGLDRTIGFPDEEPTKACPEFKRADETATRGPMPSGSSPGAAQPQAPPQVEKPKDPLTSSCVPRKEPGKALTPPSQTNWGDGPIMCPKCHTTVQMRQSQRTGQVFYKCVPCSVFINDDGTTAPAHGAVR